MTASEPTAISGAVRSFAASSALVCPSVAQGQWFVAKVSIDEVVTGQPTTVTASFARASRAPVPFEMALDACVPGQRSVIGFVPSDDEIAVDAGEPVTLVREGAIYATLDRIAFGPGLPPFYRAGVAADGKVPVPEGLTLETSPGAEFPMASVAIPGGMHLILPSSASRSITAGLVERQASAPTDDDVVVTVLAWVGSDATQRYNCRVVDDGECRLPSDVADELEGKSLSYGISRIRTRTLIADGIGWSVSRTSSRRFERTSRGR